MFFILWVSFTNVMLAAILNKKWWFERAAPHSPTVFAATNFMVGGNFTSSGCSGALASSGLVGLLLSWWGNGAGEKKQNKISQCQCAYREQADKSHAVHRNGGLIFRKTVEAPRRRRQLTRVASPLPVLFSSISCMWILLGVIRMGTGWTMAVSWRMGDTWLIMMTIRDV